MCFEICFLSFQGYHLVCRIDFDIGDKGWLSLVDPFKKDGCKRAISIPTVRSLNLDGPDHNFRHPYVKLQKINYIKIFDTIL